MVSKVKLLLLPVTAPITISPVPSVALVSIVVALPKVTASKVIASLDVSMVPFKVTVPPTSLVSNPPLKVKVSPVASPNCKVPSFAKSMSLVMVEPLPLSATLATVLPMAKVVTSTSPERVVVPPALLIV